MLAASRARMDRDSPILPIRLASIRFLVLTWVALLSTPLLISCFKSCVYHALRHEQIIISTSYTVISCAYAVIT